MLPSRYRCLVRLAPRAYPSGTHHGTRRAALGTNHIMLELLEFSFVPGIRAPKTQKAGTVWRGSHDF